MKTAIIIGASSGIGKELSKLLAQDKYQIGVSARREGLLQNLKDSIDDSCIIKPFDVTNVDDSKSKLDELAIELGKIDLLIFCSGNGFLNEDIDFDTENKTIDLNVKGFTNIVDWAYNHFKEQGHGHFVGITSIGGLRGGGQAPAYNASKAYQINYLEALRQKVNKIKMPIHFTDVRPGLVDTDMAKGEGLFWVMPPEKVSKQIYKGIKKKKKVLYVTKRWRYIAAILKILPRGIYEKL